MTTPAKIQLDNNILHLTGDWSTEGIASLQQHPFAHLVLPTFPLILDGSQIKTLDTAGVWLLEKIKALLREKHIKLSEQGFSTKQRAFIRLVENNYQPGKALSLPKPLNLFARIGRFSVLKFDELMLWMTFVGEFFVIGMKLLGTPWRIKWSYIFKIIDTMGIRALPIVGFLSFLIGVVLTYQIGLELKIYGANIYIINLLGMAILREFGPLITAIILAGRTSSAFTAQLGLMQVNEEVDALKTMGLSPSELLIFPRIAGLILVMPLLVVWADIFGILGGMMMTKAILDIGYYSFISQFPANVTLTTFFIGLCKAPAYAMIIAGVGCFHGFRVSGSSESVGWETTKSVVVAIFLIIIADAIFSVVLSWWNI